MERRSLQYIYDSAGILRELVSSATHHHVLAVFVSGIDEFFTTAVSHLSGDQSDALVFFKDSDLHGYPLEKNPCRLSEIKSVIHFDTRFDDPVYLKIREIGQA